MSADRDPIDELVASVLDGVPVDAPADRDAEDPRSGEVEALLAISRIADFNRSLQRSQDDGVPERWGHLLLLERLGAGTHAEVFRAWDTTLQREVALKLMRPDGDEAALLEEGRAAARIRHPHAVTVHGIDRRDGRVGLWMELIRGATLEQEVESHGPLEPAAAARLGAEIGSAIAAAHAAGVLHRDVKPANIVRDEAGRHVLADFGLGARRDSVARAGDASGTPMYMAPEGLAGAAASERSDVYSLGMTMWFALGGRHPFAVDSLADLTAAARRGPRPSLREVRPGVPAALAAVVERAIAPDPAKRFAAARDLVGALESGPQENGRPRHVARTAAVLAVLALAVAAGFVAWRSRRATTLSPGASAPAPSAPATAGAYAVQASLLRRDDRGSTPLVTGDRVRPGDRLSLEVRATRRAWFYVLNEDERGERYLLFPQPRFDVRNPLAADSTFVLPGPVGGRENAWTVTSAGKREYFLIVASPEPVPEIEADLSRLPAPLPGRPIDYARVGNAAVERLRGVGGVSELPARSTPRNARSPAFERFRTLAGRETGVHGVWVRQIVLENPGR